MAQLITSQTTFILQHMLYSLAMSDLPIRIAAAMKAIGFNQPQLAKAASAPGAPVSQQAVQQLISGRNSTSRHLPAIAQALGVSLDWLVAGRGSRGGRRRSESFLVGKVATGGEIRRFSGTAHRKRIDAPFGSDTPNAVEVSGNSQLPLQDGWLLYYGPEQQGVPEKCIGKLCVVQIQDGPTMLKTLHRTGRKDLYRLESWGGAESIEAKIIWAARVTDIRPL